jgi:hypothetical protein
MNRWQFDLPEAPILVVEKAAGGNTVEGPASAAPEAPEPKCGCFAVSPRPYLAALVLTCGAFVYLWWAAGREAGTWWWPAWYATALMQGLVAAMLLLGSQATPPSAASASSSSSSSSWGPRVLLLLICCSAPLLHVALFESAVEEPDRGDGRTAWADRAGKALSLATLASALLAAALWMRSARK